MNERQYGNKVPTAVKKAGELMKRFGIPKRQSNSGDGGSPPVPGLAIVAGEEYRLAPLDDGSMMMEVGEEMLEEKRMDPIVYVMVLYLHDESAPQEVIELAARFVQIAYRFDYNKNTVKGLFFYCKSNNIKNGDRYKEAMALVDGAISTHKAETLVEICKGIII